MTNKNVLYISYDGMTDNLGQSQVIPYLKGLSAEGYNITILSFEKKERFSELKNTITNLLKSASIDWFPCMYTSKPPVFSTLWDIRKMYKTALNICKIKNIKIVHCRSYISAIVGLRLKKQLGTKFIFDMRGFYPDERVEGKIWNLKNPIFKSIYKFFKKQEILFLNNADYSVSLTNAGKDNILSRIEIQKTCKIEVIPCCADLDHFDYKRISDSDKNEIRKKLGFFEQNEVYCYLGSMGTWYLLDEMLDLFFEIQSINPNAVFFFITSDDSENIIKKAVEKGISPNKIVIKSAGRSEVPLFLSICTASVFFIIPTFSKTASSPTKMAEIMGMGIPLICNDNVGDVGHIMRESGAGILVQDMGKENLQSIAIQCIEMVHLQKESIRNAAIHWYSLSEGVKRYKKIYDFLATS